jgi:UDP-glucuronate 4-epimerase
MTDYYDVRLKRRRHQMLLQHPNFAATEGLLEDELAVERVANSFQPDIIVHLAAQAGVRYSLENPRAYLDSNVIGTFNVMEAARRCGVKHLLMASTSSVYGANSAMPFTETEKADTQLTIYAATKKATESMGHAYAHLWSLPTTMFRFFTVYGPWGRPDMAYFKFAESIAADHPIELYNRGELFRDFTYVEDLVRGIRLLIDVVPPGPQERNALIEGDSLSPVAPYRIVNIGNSTKVRLLDLVEALEAALGRRAKLKLLPMQVGDVAATWADCTLLQKLTGYRPQTELRDGIARFVEWYRSWKG